MSSSVKLGATVLAAVSLAALGYFYLQSQTSSSSSATSTSTTDSKKKQSSSSPPSEIPTIDLDIFANPNRDPEAYQRECEKVAHALHHFGLVIVKDKRVSEDDNNTFLDMMEQYFEGSDGIRDARPKIGYQIGVTGERIEKPRNFCRFVGAYGPDDKPLSPCPPEFDLKWRFFWRTGPQPATTEFPLMNADPVIPPEFPQWREVMDMWGGKMTDALFTLAEMAAVGFKMAPDTFTSRLMYGPHLLAPTGSDFKKYNQLNSVLAGYHYDLNFLTIHGKSRFPGLSVWSRDGRKLSVSIPDGCLLVQVYYYVYLYLMRIFLLWL